MKISSLKLIELPKRNSNSWIEEKESSTPMSRYEKYSHSKSKWMNLDNRLLCVMESDQGVYGTSLTSGGSVVSNAVKEQVIPMLIGEDLTRINKIYDILYRSTTPYGHGRIIMSAIASVDIALWNMNSKLRHLPISNLLGGSIFDKLKVYATTSLDETTIDKNYFGYKFSPPYGPEEGTKGILLMKDMLTKIRKKIGPDKFISIDSFCSWDVEFTLEFLKETKDLGIYWVEDPLLPNDLDGYKNLKERAPMIRTAVGNFLYDPAEIYKFIKAGVVNIIQPDLTWAGGVTAAMQIGHMSNLSNVYFSPHNGATQPWATQAMSVLPNSGYAEYIVIDNKYATIPAHIYGSPSGEFMDPGLLKDLTAEGIEILQRKGKTMTIDL